MPAMIVLGDKTDHGGEVIESSGVTDTHGKGIARVGDKVHCPKKGHGTTVIVTGDNTMVIDGKAVAYHGCKTSCGATLISSQAVTTVEFGGGAGGAAAGASGPSTVATTAAASAAAAALANPETYDQRFSLTCSLTGVPLAKQPYRLSWRGGVMDGTTDNDGRTARLPTGIASEEVSCEILGDASYG